MRFRAVPVLLIFAAALLSALAQATMNDPSPEALVEGSHWKRAKAVLEPRVQANPNDAQALYLLSQVKLQYGDLNGALALAEKSAAIEARNPSYRLQVAEAVGELADKTGNWFKKLSYGRRYRREAEAVIALDAKNIPARIGLLEWHMQAGPIGGNKKVAYSLADEIMRLDPAEGYLAQVRLARLEKKSDSPEPLYLKALEANPKSFGIHMTLVNFYFSGPQQKYDLVEKHAREALKLEPGRTGGYGGLAIVFARLKRWQELDAILAQAEKNVPDNFSPLYSAGNILLVDGSDLPRAEKYFRKYLTIEPEPTSPTHADARWRLALVLEKMGRKPEAIQELQKALQLNPNHEGAKRDLKRLK